MNKSNKLNKLVAFVIVFSMVFTSILGIATGEDLSASDKLATLPITETDVYNDETYWEATRDDLVYEHYELDSFVKIGDEFLQELGLSRDDFTQEPKSDINEEKLEELLLNYFYEYDYVQTLGSVLNMLYTEDVSNTEIQQEMEYFTQLNNDVFEESLIVLQGIQKNAVLAPMLKAVIGEYNYDYIETTTSLTSAEQTIVEKILKLQQEYNETPLDDTNKLIELYINIVNQHNEYARESGYANYYEMNRMELYANGSESSEASEVAEFYQAVKDYIAPVYVYLSMNVRFEQLSAYNIPINESLQSFVEKFMGNISSELLDSYKYMVDASLLNIGTSEKNEDVSYTIRLPYLNSAAIFIKDRGDYNNLNTLIHEFGHFNTAIRDNDLSYFDEQNIDVAEIHSQYLELLFLPYSKLMYGNLANQAVTAKLLDLVWSVLTGACFNEFEEFAYTTENLNAEMLRNKFSEICRDYKLNLDDDYWTAVWHLYNSPLYYLSYSISAMASLSQLDNINHDYRKAVDNYLTLTSYDEVEFEFMELLERSNMPNIFDKDVIKNIGKSISEYASKPKLFTLEDFDMSKSPDNSKDKAEQNKPGKILPEYGDKPTEAPSENNGSDNKDKRDQNSPANPNQEGMSKNPTEIQVIEDSLSRIWFALKLAFENILP
ncbi:hypothetical protein [Fastidiosipila sanguinis]|uniref:Oligoendopeptidase F n=1 Tax=Fastidiosipila sanguinis TaxID=236753 RepID=A0A2S0KPM8_9FIRM|nr:hypothetical protein [Fastidiosipila sanguinis]AVM42959.1 hypothetical protein C5Q98_06930 [Fastidiosipila sanguinis]